MFKDIRIQVRVLMILLISCMVWISGYCNTSESGESITIHGMSIEALRVKDKVSIITTTGGIFYVDLGKGTIEIRQRVGKKRLLAKITLDKEWLKRMSGPIRNGFDCVWEEDSHGKPKMIISGDSVIRFLNIENLKVVLQFSPLHCKVNDSNGGLLALDNEGGIVIVPPKVSPNECWQTFENNMWKLSANEPLSFLFIGVCPPRPFDWDSSFLCTVHYSSHIQRYPTDEEIIAYSKYAKILEMHSWMWQNRWDENSRDEKGEKLPLWKDYSSRAQNYKWIPDSETELRRVIKTAHAHGMKIIPYVNFLREDSKTPMSEVFEIQMTEISRLKETYDFDGFYLDGLYFREPELSYKAARTLREILGKDSWLTLHDTHTSFPFINAYMDLIITSEHESFDRWGSTSYKISNAIASVWPEIPIDIKDGRELLRKIVDESLLYNNRVILMDGKQGQWRLWRLYFTNDEMKFMQDYYFNELERMKKNGYENLF